MAVLTAEELSIIRRNAQQVCQRDGIEYGGVTKTTVNAAIQAIETWWSSGLIARPANSANAAVNAATSPVTLSIEQKKLILACWLNYKAKSDGA